MGGGAEDKAIVYSLTKGKVVAVLPRDSVLAAPAGAEKNKVYLYDAVKKAKKDGIVLQYTQRGLVYIGK